MAIKAAVFYTTKVGTPEEKLNFLEVATYTEVPLVGNYIQHTGQKLLGYKVEQVTYLQPNSEQWDIVILAGGGSLKISAARYREEFYRIKNERLVRKGEIYRDRKAFENPDAIWQRRKNMYERLEAGESAEAIAAELGIQPARVKRLRNEWRSLVWRIRQYALEEESEEQA